MSRAAQMNPVAIFVGLLFWSWVWGVWGTILAVPMMMTAKAICDRVEDLQPVGELLGEIRRQKPLADHTRQRPIRMASSPGTWFGIWGFEVRARRGRRGFAASDYAQINLPPRQQPHHQDHIGVIAISASSARQIHDEHVVAARRRHAGARVALEQGEVAQVRLPADVDEIAQDRHQPHQHVEARR